MKVGGPAVKRRVVKEDQLVVNVDYGPRERRCCLITLCPRRLDCSFF